MGATIVVYLAAARLALSRRRKHRRPALSAGWGTVDVPRLPDGERSHKLCRASSGRDDELPRPRLPPLRLEQSARGAVKRRV